MEIINETLDKNTHLRDTRSGAWQSSLWVRLLRRLRLLANAINLILALPLLWIVLIYQKTISPDHGMLRPWYPYGYCKFYPSCSEYAALSLRKNGIFSLPKIIKRIISCRPGTAPAIDKP